MALSFVVVLFVAVIAPVLCLSDHPTPENYLQRTGHSVARLGDFLYIDGGWIIQHGDGEPEGLPMVPVNSTLSIPLKTKWTNTTVAMNEIKKSDAPDLIRETLWIDHNRQAIYMWADRQKTDGTLSNDTRIWKLVVDGTGGGFWKFEDSDSVAQTQTAGFHRATAGAAATCFNTGFQVGGQMTGENEKKILVPGLLTYNMTSQLWANDSATAFTSHGTSLGAEAVCLPCFGPHGLVLFIGGVTSVSDDAYNAYSALGTSAGVPFDNITLYDPFAKQWYWQTTTGNRPTPRHEFCAEGVEGPQGTFEIYVYSGFSTQSGSLFGDLYVLSLPGFVWFKANYTPTTTRGFSRCAALGDSQMIIIGGTTGSDPDPWGQGIGVFDLPSMSLKASYDPEAGPYDSPQVVKDWYSNRGLDSVHWSSRAVKELFVSSNKSNTTSM
ncbi:hypothetical protein GQ53DRAFT_823023 [Thozetella sp. PMI_491]|nr:hypothetical protein GQ53DRAFT_823023 [Thozetella sp. PMI_491]